MKVNEYLLAHKDDGRNDNPSPSGGSSDILDVSKGEGEQRETDTGCDLCASQYPVPAGYLPIE